MSKKDYIDAVNEIQIDENLKRETLSKIKENKKQKTYYKIQPIIRLATVCAVIMIIVISSKTIAPTEKITYLDVAQTGTLPKVENFNNLYGILKERAKEEINDIKGLPEFSIDLAVTDSITNSSIEKQESQLADKDFSRTNVQVEGVDEADIVKTDGKYIYYLAGNKLIIANVSNDNIISESEIEFNENEFYAQELFIKENKLIVIGTRTAKEEKKMYTVANVYNIEDKENPVQDRTVEIEGSYISSRMIGDNIYLLSNKYSRAYLCKENKESELNEDEFKPQYKDTVISSNVKCIEFDRIYYIPESEDTNYLNIAGFNVKNNQPANIESYLGAGDIVYSSETNLYITNVNYNYQKESQDIKTEIYKFELKDGKCIFSKTGTVPGTVLNQFSMDEKNGYFRIATTSNKFWNDEDNTNNLYVLNRNLEIVGKVEGLALGERIYSVRFMGDRAYMVTFVQTDPLFVIDLQEPTQPKVLGELKIPGYSKYLHPYDETHLIGIGESTKVVNYGYGDRVITDGMKMSLFDVTDPSNPKEMYNVNIGNKGTYSEILYNHKALLFSKEKNIIAFPVSITKDEYEVTFQGAVVYNISLDKGFELRGKITNIGNDLDKYYRGNSVERIIYIKDTLYTLSKNLIKATDLKTMEEIGSMDIK